MNYVADRHHEGNSVFEGLSRASNYCCADVPSEFDHAQDHTVAGKSVSVLLVQLYKQQVHSTVAEFIPLIINTVILSPSPWRLF